MATVFLCLSLCLGDKLYQSSPQTRMPCSPFGFVHQFVKAYIGLKL